MQANQLQSIHLLNRGRSSNTLADKEKVSVTVDTKSTVNHQNKKYRAVDRQSNKQPGNDWSFK
jgi:hypothetical protein